MVPNDFWKPVIKRLQEMKPDLFMLAEWENYTVFDAGFDAAYDWTLFHRMRATSEGKVGLDSLWKIIEGVQNTIPKGKEMMRFVENHDEQRSAKTFGWPEVKPFSELVFTLPGIPLIYSGQEIGQTHKPSSEKGFTSGQPKVLAERCSSWFSTKCIISLPLGRELSDAWMIFQRLSRPTLPSRVARMRWNSVQS